MVWKIQTPQKFLVTQDFSRFFKVLWKVIEIDPFSLVFIQNRELLLDYSTFCEYRGYYTRKLLNWHPRHHKNVWFPTDWPKIFLKVLWKIIEIDRFCLVFIQNRELVLDYSTFCAYRGYLNIFEKLIVLMANTFK